MIAHFNRPFAFLLIALAMVPSRAFAQLSVPGKLMTYRTVDSDSGEELQRMRVWVATDGLATAEVTDATYPTGTQVISECAFAHGFGRSATSFRSVMRAANGELERSDFDTFDPVYYPFLAQPITTDMQPETCLDKRALDLPALVRGAETKMWIWSDSGLIGAIFHREDNDRLTVAAGTFDALRIRIDTDLSKVFPRVPALFLKLIKPHFTIWITRAEPYYVLKMEGFGSERSSQHQNTAIELASMSELTAIDSKTLPELTQVDAAGADPHLTTVNSGRFAQGDRSGRLTLATAATPEGELLLTHVAFSNGLTTETRSLIDRRASPVTAYLDDRSFGVSGVLVRKHVLFFRKAAFPGDPTKDLPADLYGGDMTLGLVLPRLLPEGAHQASFHVMDFYGQVNQLTISEEGPTNVALASDDMRAIHTKLKPIVEVPLLLRPLAYFFIPSFDAYFDLDGSHRLLKFEGPIGPPGVPNATMIADEKVPPSQASRHR
jgi:hypothetical protein